MFNKLKDNTIFSGFSQTQHNILLYFISFNLDIIISVKLPSSGHLYKAQNKVLAV